MRDNQPECVRQQVLACHAHFGQAYNTDESQLPPLHKAALLPLPARLAPKVACPSHWPRGPALPKRSTNPSASLVRGIRTVPVGPVEAGRETHKRPQGPGHSVLIRIGCVRSGALGWIRESLTTRGLHLPCHSDGVSRHHMTREKPSPAICFSTVMEDCCGLHQGVPVSDWRVP
jgi:hypothetical protein